MAPALARGDNTAVRSSTSPKGQRSRMTEIVAVDVGGTHARFAIATIEGSRVTSLADEEVLRTADYPGLAGAWNAFADRRGRSLPRAAAIAVAGPISGDVLQLTNHP